MNREQELRPIKRLGHTACTAMVVWHQQTDFLMCFSCVLVWSLGAGQTKMFLMHVYRCTSNRSFKMYDSDD